MRHALSDFYEHDSIHEERSQFQTTDFCICNVVGICYKYHICIIYYIFGRFQTPCNVLLNCNEYTLS